MKKKKILIILILVVLCNGIHWFFSSIPAGRPPLWFWGFPLSWWTETSLYPPDSPVPWWTKPIPMGKILVPRAPYLEPLTMVFTPFHFLFDLFFWLVFLKVSWWILKLWKTEFQKSWKDKEWGFLLLKLIAPLGWIVSVGFLEFACFLALAAAISGGAHVTGSLFKTVLFPCSLVFKIMDVLIPKRIEGIAGLILYFSGVTLLYLLVVAGGMYLIFRVLGLVRERILKRRGKLGS